jgi:hypothetical protein
MALSVTVTPGTTVVDGTTPLNAATLNAIATPTVSVTGTIGGSTSVSVDGITIDQGGAGSSLQVVDAGVTATKLAATLNLASKTVTLPATSVTAAMLAATLDLSTKTVTLPATSVTAAMLAATLDLSAKTVTLGNTTVGVLTKASAGAHLAHGSATYASGTVTVSTSDPSGGSNGDVWLKYS